MTIEQYNVCGEDLTELLRLRFSPIAFKLIRESGEIPEGYLQPSKDLHGRFAVCQGFALVRRDRLSLALLGQDHGCVWPMIGYGMVPFDPAEYETEGAKLFGPDGNIEYNLFIKDSEKAKAFFKDTFPRTRGYIGILAAPLDIARFKPDTVLIYVRPTQLRSLLMAVKYGTGRIVESQFDSVQSCLYSTVSAIIDGNYKITVPDPGEYKRASCDEDEMIFTVPGSRLNELIASLKELSAFGIGYRELNKEVEPMAVGGFYSELLKKWGMQ